MSSNPFVKPPPDPDPGPIWPYDPMKEQWPWATEHTAGSMLAHGYTEQVQLSQADLKREDARLRKKRRTPTEFGFQPPDEEA